MDVIKLQNVSKKFGKFFAISDISFSVQKGEIIGFVGPNGAGKSTTINMLLGFIAASSGSISIFGETIQPQSAQKSHKHSGFAAGDMALFDTLTGEQYLDYFANQYGSSTRRQELVTALSPKLGTPLKQLSRGNKQKIAIIAALQHEPKLIILDEPTTGLDPLMQKVFLQEMEKEKDRGATILMSSHILSEVAEISDRVLFMRDGKIIIDQPIADIRGNEGKIVTVTLQKSTTVKPPHGASKVAHTKNTLQFTYTGSVNDLSSWLNAHKFSDYSVRSRTLDEVFEHLYEHKEIAV